MAELFFNKTYRDFVEFVSSAQNELIILSPYIKLEAIKLLLEKVAPGIKVTVVARWKLSDLIFGSSDVGVFEYLKSCGHNFYIHNKIHLKVVVRDKQDILLGSANITSSGLGLFEGSNVEAITIDGLDEKYLPEIYSILRDSIEVTGELVAEITKELEVHKTDKLEQAKIEEELEKVERQLYVSKKKNVVTYDFVFCESPKIFLQNIESNDMNAGVLHDLKMLGLTPTGMTRELIQKAFLNSAAYVWQLQNIKTEALFGKYSELLHNALVDDPKPYRKQVKELVANMFAWTEEFSNDFETKKYNHTTSLIRK